jgi:two-component system, cell cycle sensor histidine kinase and response regulator CckA
MSKPIRLPRRALPAAPIPVAPALALGMQGTPDDPARAERDERLRHGQQLALVARGLAHDLNNLLTLVATLSDYQRQLLPAQDPLRQSAEEIHWAALRAGALASRLLGLSRPVDPAPRPVNLNLLVLGLETMLRHLLPAGTTLETVLDPALAPVEASPGGLEQVLLNLVLNARDAMPHGGRVTITTANRSVDSAAPGAGLPRGAYVTLAVSDTGCGMDAATQARIFEPFFTTKGVGQGTGLGLAIVADVVQQSGGFLRVTSAPGRGTTFTIYLHRPEEGPPAEATEAPAAPAKAPRRILVVEDHYGVRLLITEILTQAGYPLLVARDGPEALELCRNNPGDVRLLITDVVLPRMTGPEVAERVRALAPGAKVLYVSGDSADEGDRPRPLPPGNDFLPKPFTASGLLAKVRAVLGEEGG